MTKFILFVNGVLAARYDSAIHGDAIPAEAKPVSDALFLQTINETDGIWTLHADDSITKEPFPPKTLAELKQDKLLEVNTAFEQSMLPIVNGVPDFERESWKKQEEEARAYQVNNAAATPLLDSLAATRGISKAELVTRIITKADLFATVSGQLIGKRQKLEDQINALPANATATDVAAIVW